MMQAIKSFLREFLCLGWAGLLFPLGFCDPDPKKLPADTQKAVVLVHGFLHNKSAFATLLPHLKRDLSYPVFTINLGSPFKSIEEYVELLKQKLMQIKQMPGGENLQFMLVGHSMGGIVAVHTAADLEEVGDFSVSKVITISSPIKGSPRGKWLSWMMLPARQMMPESAYLKRLEERALKLKQVQIFHIGADFDAIAPLQHSHFDFNAKNFALLKGHGHISPLYTKTLLKILQKVI